MLTSTLSGFVGGNEFYSTTAQQITFDTHLHIKNISPLVTQYIP